MSTFILLALSILLYTAFQLLVVRAGGKLDDYLSGTIISAASVVTPLIAYLAVKAGGKPLLPTTSAGIWWSVGAGLLVGLYSALLVRVFASNGAAYASPLIYGSSLALVALVGWIALREKFDPLQGVGVAIVAIGVGVVVYAKWRATNVA